jgi:hypothetical protein
MGLALAAASKISRDFSSQSLNSNFLSPPSNRLTQARPVVESSGRIYTTIIGDGARDPQIQETHNRDCENISQADCAGAEKGREDDCAAEAGFGQE